MLSRGNDTAVHVKNIQKLMTEFCKYLYGLSAPIKKSLQKRALTYNPRSCGVTLLLNPKTKKYCTDRKAAQIWSMIPAKYKICHR